MSDVPFFNETLSQSIHDDLLGWAQSCYAPPENWTPLWLNQQCLGLLSEPWKTRLLNTWHGNISQVSDGIHLSADNWLVLEDSLQNLAWDWKQLGILQGWRNERFDVCNHQGQVFFSLERAAFRPFGLLSHAVHLNGLSNLKGEWYFWIGKRSPHKAVDPNKLDNLVSGGVSSGEQILEAAIRESEEEAGLSAQWVDTLKVKKRLHSLRQVSRGLHNEILHIFDVILPPEIQPENQDGEVASFELMSVSAVVEAMLSGQMMNDAQLVTLDAFSRYGLLKQQHPFTQWLQQIQV